jgi:hypothetical protein
MWLVCFCGSWRPAIEIKVGARGYSRCRVPNFLIGEPVSAAASIDAESTPVETRPT